MNQESGNTDKAKPSERRGRKAAGLTIQNKMAELPKVSIMVARLFLFVSEGGKCAYQGYVQGQYLRHGERHSS